MNVHNRVENLESKKSGLENKQTTIKQQQQQQKILCFKKIASPGE